MKTVRIENGIVKEIIPDYATPVSNWYGNDFAMSCVDAPDEVEQNWVYDQDNGTFSAPEIKEPEIVIDTEQYLLDLDFRVSTLELLGGVINDL